MKTVNVPHKDPTEDTGLPRGKLQCPQGHADAMLRENGEMSSWEWWGLRPLYESSHTRHQTVVNLVGSVRSRNLVFPFLKKVQNSALLYVFFLVFKTLSKPTIKKKKNLQAGFSPWLPPHCSSGREKGKFFLKSHSHRSQARLRT